MICQYCGKEYKNVKQHERLCKLNPNHVDLTYLTQNAINTNKKLKGTHKTEYKEYEIICPNCGKSHIEFISVNNYNKGNYKKYCCSSCANTRQHTDETKQKISNSLTKNNCAKCVKNKKTNTHESTTELLIETQSKERICKICNKTYYKNNLYPNATNIFCSSECKEYYITHRRDFLSNDALLALSNAGKKSAQLQSEIRRSKNEIYFCELCEQYFNNVEHNKSIFNGWDADVIIHDIKYAILWNGKWHYEKIAKHHSVLQVQNRDNIKIKEIQDYGYTPYIIKDMGKYNPDFVKEQFNIFLTYIATTDHIVINE